MLTAAMFMVNKVLCVWKSKYGKLLRAADSLRSRSVAGPRVIRPLV